jgi:hypothetical protein
MVHRVQVRPIDNDEGNKLLRIVRRSSGSVVTWRRAQMVLLSAQGMDVPMIAKVTFASPDRVRDVIHNFNADGFDSLQPKYAGGRPPSSPSRSGRRSRRPRWPARTITGCRSPRGACPSWPTSWSLGGGRRHLPRGPADAAARGGRLLSKP